ncbi:hypothetical protein [uncultured Acetobacteroides sp.]|uniref:hypothetical protein n=1 Tax=uncultured Acetobacteroides sp. TaxID=1760811 RepID=UPI0029F5B9AD|nr:hypothetical protein [uncultured Acetobacteroides sp.]
MSMSLSDEEINQICMYMRIVDFMRDNQEMVESNPEMVELVAQLNTCVGKIMDVLTDEEKDELLEEHRFQLEEIRNPQDDDEDYDDEEEDEDYDEEEDFEEEVDDEGKNE